MNIRYAERLNSVEEYYFSRKLEQIQGMRNQGISVISLGIGSPDLMPAESALNATAEAVKSSGNHGYAPYRSTPALREAMGEWYERDYGVKLNAPSEILPLLGSKEGILYLSLALLNPGDTVLVPNPGYPAYAKVAKMIGAVPIEYDLTDETGWLPDFRQLERVDYTRCKLLWLNYPHMPTGKACDLSFFKKVVDFARAKNIIVCNDNPYSLVLNQERPISILNADVSMQAACELNSLSKSFNMAGWRIGMFCGKAELVDAVLQMKSNVDSGMFLALQKGAIQALREPPTFHQDRNHVYERRRGYLYRIFDLLGFTYDPGQVGLFVWAKAPESVPDVTSLIDEILMKAHVFLTPGMVFGSNGNRYARASLCADEANLQEAVKRIERFVS